MNTLSVYWDEKYKNNDQKDQKNKKIKNDFESEFRKSMQMANYKVLFFA